MSEALSHRTTEASPHCEAAVCVQEPADAGCLGIHYGLGGRPVEDIGFLCTPHADYVESKIEEVP